MTPAQASRHVSRYQRRREWAAALGLMLLMILGCGLGAAAIAWVLS
jgi:hypothetical protein